MEKWVASTDIRFRSVLLERRSVHLTKGIILLKISGRNLKSSKADYLANLLQNEFDSQNFNLIIDCSSVDLMFSIHIGMLLSFCKKLRAIGGEVCFFNVNDSILAVFERLGVLSTLSIRKDLETAEEFFA